MLRKEYFAALACIASVVGIFVLREQHSVWFTETPHRVPVVLESTPWSWWRSRPSWRPLGWDDFSEEERLVGCRNMARLARGHEEALVHGAEVCAYGWKSSHVARERFWEHVRPTFPVSECPASFLFWPTDERPITLHNRSDADLFLFLFKEPGSTPFQWTRVCA
jgi:hypothetical protein